MGLDGIFDEGGASEGKISYVGDRDVSMLTGGLY